MAFENYVLAETNSFTKEKGCSFDCTINESFDLIPVEMDPDPWEEFLETAIEKVTEIETGVYQYDFVIEDKNIDEDDYDDEDYTYVATEYKIGEKLDFIPTEAVNSTDVTLKEITKSGDDFIMTLFIEAEDPDDEDQTMNFTIRKGVHLEVEELELGIVCFVGPDINPVDVEVVDVSEEGITLRKC